MLQIIQYQKTGEISVDDLPMPQLKQGGILVRNYCSIISAGTERTSVETAQASMIGKAKARPDLVKQVMDNLHREGVLATINKVRNRLDNYKELGYSSSGIVVQSACEEFSIGDRVACGGYAYHAEIVSIPKNLAVKIPDSVSYDEAAFTTLGAIALQGIRQADIKMGEYVAVIGLGLIGLITVQLLKANGCRVIGIDINPKRFNLALESGCNECVVMDDQAAGAVLNFTSNKGIDSILITASTNSNVPMEFASRIGRRKAKIVLVGRVSMNVPYMDAYKKELEYKMSCSYGPGRYDTVYEENGNDYPYEFVRWTENRNMAAVLDLLADNKISFKSLVTHKYPIESALTAYDIITEKTKADYLAVLLEYPCKDRKVDDSIKHNNKTIKLKYSGNSIIGFIGAGNFAQSYLLPTLVSLRARLKTVCTIKPVSAMSAAKKYGFTDYTTNIYELLNDKCIDTIFITTRHNTHGRLVIEGLKHNKNIYVEKPLCTDPSEMVEIMKLIKSSGEVNGKFIMVGYNRRFSRAVNSIKDFFSGVDEPLIMNYRINAGYLPADNWYQNPEQKGRIIGEVCHFVDTLQYICHSLPYSVFARELKDYSHQYFHDNVAATITFANGSVGTINYYSKGARTLPKEYLEISGGGKSAVLNDFKTLSLFDYKKTYSQKYHGDKGHADEMKAVFNFINNSDKINISPEEVLNTSNTVFAILDSIQCNTEIKVKPILL